MQKYVITRPQSVGSVVNQDFTGHTASLSVMHFFMLAARPEQRLYVHVVQNRLVLYSTVQHSTAQYSTVQHSTVQYSTAQYSTVQYSTVQYSTVQYSTGIPMQILRGEKWRIE